MAIDTLFFTPPGGTGDGDDEAPRVVVRDIATRPRPHGHVIAFANEKGGVGKSTLAFQTAIALADAGYRVAAIDLDRRQQSLGRAFANRDASTRRLCVCLPRVSHTVLTQQSGSLLFQEIARIGAHADYIIIDAPGHDTPLVRRAIAMAHTLITPVNPSFVDLDLLGRFDGMGVKYNGLGYFARLVGEIREERENRRLPSLDWVVAPNRMRFGKSHNEAQVLAALGAMTEPAGFRLASGIGERCAFRELFLLGLTHLDVRRIPALPKPRSAATQEITRFIRELRLPVRTEGNLRRVAGWVA